MERRTRLSLGCGKAWDFEKYMKLPWVWFFEEKHETECSFGREKQQMQSFFFLYFGLEGAAL